MSTPKKVTDERAAQVVEEVAVRFPGLTNRELYAACREHKQCPVSLKQVDEIMRNRRTQRRRAFLAAAPVNYCTHGVLRFVDSRCECDRCGENLTSEREELAAADDRRDRERDR